MKSFGNIAKDGQVRAVASGALTDGKAVIVNSDGTVSVVSGSAASVGSKTTFESGTTNHIGAVYDVNANKIVVCYRDLSNSYYGTAVVGTISGTSISFGSPVVFQSSNSQYSHTIYDANAQKIVNYYSRDPDNYGMAIVGTVSGTSISFGTATVYKSAELRTLGAAYATNSSTSAVIYRLDSNDTVKAVAGTVSGTGISFGSEESVYNSATTGDGDLVFGTEITGLSARGLAFISTSSGIYSTTVVTSGTNIYAYSSTQISSSAGYSLAGTFDDNAKRFLIVYSDSGNSYQGKARVGKVTATTAAYGTEVQFGTDNNISNVGITYNSSTDKPIVVYRNNSDSNTMYVVEATITDTDVAFDTAISTSLKTDENPFPVYNSSTDSTAIAFRNPDNSDYGEAFVYTGGSTNLTSENFIGFSDGAFANTDSAAINTTNTIDRNQSSLTAGQTYFVQVDGTLGLTADDPSVTAGTAISATELIVKG